MGPSQWLSDTRMCTLEMQPDPFTVRCHLHGEIDLACVDQLRAALRRLVASGRPIVQVDLSGLEFLAVSGLNALLAARAELLAEGRDLRLLRPQPHIDRTLRICGLADAISATPESVRPSC